MHEPLVISHLLDRVGRYYGPVEIVTRRPDRQIHRTTWGKVARRAVQLGNALRRLGLRDGDRVATLCWNHSQHLEAYLGVPSAGLVIHTLNLRLHPSELAYIASHAEDRALIVDRSLLPLFEKFRAEVPTIEHVIVVDEGDPIAGTHDYEALISGESTTPSHAVTDENAAAMFCYTSGTTGHPKGVAYSHRSTVLHALVATTRDMLGVGASDTVLPVVPMFHAAAWGLPYVAATVGAKVVMPGPHLDPTSILELMANEKVTLAAGVPTIWLGILSLLDGHPGRWDLSALRTTLIGGSAAPPSMIEGFRLRHGVEITHAWGMTETSPLGSVAFRKPHMKLDEAGELAVRASQGLAAPLVEVRHVDGEGKPLPWDGSSMGELEVRGPWVAASYLGDVGHDRWTADGWFKTGDVVTLDPEGYIRITDRAKDVVKSGGEWISSVDLENALMAHPAIAEAAVFAGRHEKWGERPIAAVVVRAGHTVSDEELRAHLEARFSKWWMPDAYVRIEQIPRTSTGKFQKSKLRDEYGDMLLR